MSHDLLDTTWEDPTWEDGTPRRRRWPFVTLGLILALGLAYLGVAWWFGGRVPAGTTVAGVDVGGQTRDEAARTLTSGFAEATESPVTLSSRAGEVELEPAQLGLAVDADATAEALTGFSLDPRVVWSHVAGGGAEPAVVIVDRPTFDAAVEEVRGDLDAEPKEGSLSVAGGEVAYSAPVPGSRVDVAGTADAVRAGWPAESTIDVAAESIAPKVRASEFERVRTEFAEVAVSAPVTVEVGEKSFTLEPEDFARAIVIEPDDDGTITPRANDKRLLAVVHAAADDAEVEREAKDATVTFSGLKPTVRKSVPGVVLDDASITSQVWAAIAGTERTATVTTSPTEPEWTTAEVRATLPKGKISSFTTYFACCQTRVKNIQRGGAAVDGTYVLPGEQFSLNEVLGDTTTASSGYLKAGIIRNGRAAEARGGGLSQLSTTLFNAAFFSGMQLDAWTPHSYYISRYPEGREATISYPDLHHKWTNTTDGGVLVKVRTTGTSITVDFHGQKKWDIEATKSARYDVTQPKKIYDDDPKCIPQDPVVGFAVDVGRIFKQGGKVVKTQSFTTRYIPEDDVTCTYSGS
jgi:vancomycin resistance protein YoaR